MTAGARPTSLLRWLLAAAVALAGAATALAAAAAPGAGDPAPDFVLQGTDGRLYALEDFKGERELVLAWFPKAFTPG